jgi:hypothetical protein
MPAIQTNLHIIRRAAVLVAGLALPPTANASFTAATAEQRIACTPDVFRLCSSEIPNVGQIITCMIAKKASLTPACRSVFDEALAKRAASRN